MDLKCRILGHKWEHCRCLRCGEKRDSDHLWDGCVCSVCGRVRNTGHSYALQPESYKTKGNVTGEEILLPTHTLYCVKCEGKTIPRAVKFEPHVWTGRGCMTKCSVCGAMPAQFTDREEYTLYSDKYGNRKLDVSHRWSGRTCRDKCLDCGRKYVDVRGGHEWSGDSCRAVCRYCGKKRPDGRHRWKGDRCIDVCSVCGVRNPEGKHSWTGDTCTDVCTLCGARYPDHKYEMVASWSTSYGTKIGRYRCTGCGREYEAPYEWGTTDSV